MEYTHLNDPVAASAEVVDSNDPDLALWALELNADVKGMQFAAYVSQHNSHDVPTSLTGPYVFLTAVDLLQKGISVIQTGEVRDHISRTHPPAWLRRDLLTQTIRQSADDGDNDILWHAEAITHAGDRLWTELADRFRAARSRGVRPAIEQRDAI